ncbi:EamA family transporter [Heliobacillus mobilis]|uniref:EamA family transporter n=1 Tax=Heliobacterium mobile TaxID=28064 RepID=A0A6I3SHI5_HELMO|nr:DMT family transporter [Heliobacterium mobile]MTV48300.1 EamA family transporter [Heliobacterium mobile]
MKFKANLLLLMTAFIWGFAFVAQRVGMDFVGPYTFNGVRFALGAASLLPLIWYFRRDSSTKKITPEENSPKAWKIGILAGTVLFIAASLQQIGLLYTTAGKAAFITCLYIVLVPLTGLFIGHRITMNTWAGSVLSAVGLYFLCVKSDFTVSYGDLLELIGAAFWTFHILLIDRYAAKIDNLVLAFWQFITCSALSMVVALTTEEIVPTLLLQAAVPILYGGLCSVGIAYTLQIIGQKHAEPTHAAIIMSMETVFATLGGYLILGEILGPHEIIGMVLMAVGMLIAQLHSFQIQNQES